MAFSTTISQPAVSLPKPAAKSAENAAAAPLLAALLLSVMAAQKSKRGMARLKRQAMLQLLKYQAKERFNRIKYLFSKNRPADVSNRTLLYILLALIVLVLIFIEPIVALIILLIGLLVLLLTGRV